MPELTVERLREVLDYDPETGAFKWLRDSENGGRRKAGASAGYRGKYLMIGIDGVVYYAHRLAVVFMTGQFPAEDTDHINGNKHDNRWSNLRPASRTVNMQNLRTPPKTNTSGFLGATFDSRKQRWVAQIREPGNKHRYLGTYPTPEEAHQAYLTAKRRLHEGCTI